MDDIAQLVVTPFQEIVDKGKTAIENAGQNEQMLKAAQALVKEGERALKKIEPLCRKYSEDHGIVFHNALKENNEITRYREELNDLLWDFDEYIDSVDNFDPAKFTELQALSRKAAPKIHDMLIKMRLDPAAPDIPTPSSSIHNSSGKHDSPVPRHSLTASPFRRDSLSSVPRNMSTDGDAVEEATRELEGLMSANAAEHRPFSYQLEPNHQPGMQWPQTMSNPWDTNPLQISKINQDDLPGHRPSASGSESPIDPAVSPFTEPHNRTYHGHQQHPSIDSSYADTNSQRPMSHDSYGTSSDNQSLMSSHVNFSPGRSPLPAYANSTSYPRMTMVPSPASATIPENGPLDSSGGLAVMQNSAGTNQHMKAFNQLVESSFGGFEARRPPILSNHNQAYSASDPAVTSRVSPKTETAKLHQDGLEVSPGGLAFDQSMPIPVEVDNMPEIKPHVTLPPSADCVIGETSSFWLAKGFCEGAREVLGGRLGVRKTRKPVGFTSSTTVARCTSCMCEHDFRDMDKDVKKDPAGNFRRTGVSYRLRFLQKSHIAAKRSDDVQYGCLFCVQQGFTMDESDATVFFSPKALLDHIARHPRPLPEVPGVNVVDCIECPAPLKDNFDLLFIRGPVLHPAIDNKLDCIHLPSGVAREAARRLYGQRLLFDRTPALELAPGARVTGLTWPPQHNGEWAMGWHDGLYASVPTDILKLTVPRPSEIRKGGTGMIRARAKWKFNPNTKDSGELWLKLDKNEMITNVGWSFFDHWCWSGTNSKGKWGIFPQAFIDTNTLEEPTGLDRATSLKNERERSTSIMSNFRRKASLTRPPSIAESSSSKDEKAKKRANSVQKGRGVEAFLGVG